MDVVEVGQLDDGTPVLLNRLATEADGVVLINRVKPHTSFRGTFESGLMKMMTIGLGSHKGATIAHAGGAESLARLIPAWGRCILDQAPILMGVGPRRKWPMKRPSASRPCHPGNSQAASHNF